MRALPGRFQSDEGALGEDAIARGDERHDRVEAEDVIDAVRAGAASAAEHAARGGNVWTVSASASRRSRGRYRDVAGVDPNV